MLPISYAARSANQIHILKFSHRNPSTSYGSLAKSRTANIRLIHSRRINGRAFLKLEGLFQAWAESPIAAALAKLAVSTSRRLIDISSHPHSKFVAHVLAQDAYS
jgi:hypothetical protein